MALSKTTYDYLYREMACVQEIEEVLLSMRADAEYNKANEANQKTEAMAIGLSILAMVATNGDRGYRRYGRENAKINVLTPQRKERLSGLFKTFDDYYKKIQELHLPFIDEVLDSGDYQLGDSAMEMFYFKYDDVVIQKATRTIDRLNVIKDAIVEQMKYSKDDDSSEESDSVSSDGSEEFEICEFDDVTVLNRVYSISDELIGILKKIQGKMGDLTTYYGEFHDLLYRYIKELRFIMINNIQEIVELIKPNDLDTMEFFDDGNNYIATDYLVENKIIRVNYLKGEIERVLKKNANKEYQNY